MDLPNKEELKNDLRNAIKNNEFVLYYQPQFNLATSMFDGIEALLRWKHPTRGLLLPKDFLTVAEEAGFIIIIGEWVLKTACKQNKAWQEKGFVPVRMAVNISSRQFHQRDFVEMVVRVLNDVRLKPKYLELELTENIILHDADKVIQQIQRLKNLGISIALDDFGTGYSSISYLKRIAVDRIKIDKSFIQNAHQDKNDLAIVRSIITLAEGLNVQVVAEGVETLKQLKPLLAYHCDEVQGFYFSVPLPADEIEKILFSFQEDKEDGENE